MAFKLLFSTLLAIVSIKYSTAVSIGFTESDYSIIENSRMAVLTLTVSDTPIPLNITLTIMSFDQFEDSGISAPAALLFESRNPAEYSLDPTGRRDFINNGQIHVLFNASSERQSQDVIVEIIDDVINEAEESFLVVIDQGITIPEDIPEFVRQGIALVTIVNDDLIQLQFNRKIYTVYEAEGEDNEEILVTKGGVISEQILMGLVEVESRFPKPAEIGVDVVSNKTFRFTLFPGNDSVQVPVSVVDDTVVEDIERFGLLLSVDNSLATIGTNNTATTFIVDSNDVVIGFENTSYTVAEGDSVEVCVIIKGLQNRTLDFFVLTSITSQDGSATAQQDYSEVSEQFPATKRNCYEISTIDNNVTEPNKNFSLNIMFTTIGMSRTFDTDTPFVPIEIINDDIVDFCRMNDCHINADCLSSPDEPGYSCVCKQGYIGDGRSCDDPCSPGRNNCSENAVCRNTSSTPFYQCTCKLGYIGNGFICTAICSPGSHDCHPDAMCIPNLDGRNYSCMCKAGFIGDGIECVDECEVNAHNCHSAANCIPISGGHTCVCKRGFIGNGTNCEEICSPGTHTCHPEAYCIPNLLSNSYFCRCGIGLIGDGRMCDNYCKAGLDNCHRHADCTPTPGGYQCKCRAGFTGNGFTCTDIDECLTDNECDFNAICENTEGSFNCFCKENFLGDGFACSEKQLDPTTQPNPTTAEPTTPTTLPTTEMATSTTETTTPTTEPTTPTTEATTPTTELTTPTTEPATPTTKPTTPTTRPTTPTPTPTRSCSPADDSSSSTRRRRRRSKRSKSRRSRSSRTSKWSRSSTRSDTSTSDSTDDNDDDDTGCAQQETLNTSKTGRSSHSDSTRRSSHSDSTRRSSHSNSKRRSSHSNTTRRSHSDSTRSSS